MNEWTLLWQFPLRLAPSIIFAMLYAIGGRANTGKWVRRFIAPLVYTLLCILLSYLFNSFIWYLPLAFLALPFTLSMGYGGENIAEKLYRRSFYGLAFGLTGLAVGIVMGNPMLGIIQLALSLVISVVFGLLNPVHAVYEESIIGFLSVCLIPFLI